MRTKHVPAGAGRTALLPGTLLALVLACVSGCLPEGLRAQEPADASAGPRWFPRGSPFPSLLADPREVGLRGSFILADRPGLEDLPVFTPAGPTTVSRDYAGRNVEAAVAIGHRFGVVRFQRETAGRPAVQLGFEVGAFSRFFMETAQKDLIDVTYRVGFPLSLAYRGWEARADLLHESSHLGDDYLSRFGFPRAPDDQVSREGLELLVARRIARDFRAYAGGDANFHANREVERTDVRWGAEWEPLPAADRGLGSRLVAWPYAAADFLLTEKNRRVAGTGVAGLGMRVQGVTVRLEARGHYGPSTMGQFRNVSETFWGLGLRVEPW